jgi:hypothetical protein
MTMSVPDDDADVRAAGTDSTAERDKAFGDLRPAMPEDLPELLDGTPLKRLKTTDRE